MGAQETSGGQVGSSSQAALGLSRDDTFAFMGPLLYIKMLTILTYHCIDI